MNRGAFLLLVISLVAGSPSHAGAPAVKTGPLVAARAAVLMDRATGEILWARNADQTLQMASTTKIMTAMVILDHGAKRLDERVTVSDAAFAVGGNSVLDAGDVLALRDLLRAILVASSNAGAEAAAEHLAGSEEIFVGWMNDKAKELGLRHMHFANPHGMPDALHYTTARELALIARHAVTRYPMIREMVASGYPKPDFIQVSPRGAVRLENRNKLLGAAVPGVPGSRVDGIKTGYVLTAGKCLVSSATLGDWGLIAVLLDSADIFTESQTLLSYGFRRYEWKTYASARTAGSAVPIAWGAKRRVPLGVKGVLGAPALRPRFGGRPADRVVFAGQRLKAPVRQGQEVGVLELRREGRVIACAPAIALEDVPVSGWARLLAVLGVGLGAFVVLLAVGIIYGTAAKGARRRRRLLAASRGGADYGRSGDGQR